MHNSLVSCVLLRCIMGNITKTAVTIDGMHCMHLCAFSGLLHICLLTRYSYSHVIFLWQGRLFVMVILFPCFQRFIITAPCKGRWWMGTRHYGSALSFGRPNKIRVNRAVSVVMKFHGNSPLVPFGKCCFLVLACCVNYLFRKLRFPDRICILPIKVSESESGRWDMA